MLLAKESLEKKKNKTLCATDIMSVQMLWQWMTYNSWSINVFILFLWMHLLYQVQLI